MWETSSNTTIEQLVGGRSNAFLVTQNNLSILVDTSRKFYRPQLKIGLTNSLGKQGIPLSLLFLTHAHFDHAENAAWIRENYRPQTVINQAEADFLTAGQNSETNGAITVTRFLVSLVGKTFNSRLTYPPVNIDITFDDKLDLQQFSIDAFLMHTPGHTVGSSSLILADEIALVGDTLFGVFPNSAYPPFVADHNQLLHSWKRLLDTGCQLFLPSHGRAIHRNLLQKDYYQRIAGH